MEQIFSELGSVVARQSVRLSDTEIEKDRLIDIATVLSLTAGVIDHQVRGETIALTTDQTESAMRSIIDARKSLAWLRAHAADCTALDARERVSDAMRQIIAALAWLDMSPGQMTAAGA